MVIAVLAGLLLCIVPCAASPDFYDAFQSDTLEQAVPKAVSPVIVEGIGSADSHKGFLNILSLAAKLASGSVGNGLRTALLITVIAALCAVAGSVTDVSIPYIRLAGTLAVAALTVTGLHSLMTAGRDALAQMDTFSKALLPSLAAAAAASGKPAAAVLRQTGTVIASDLLITMYDRLLCPLLYVYAALITFNAALPRDMVKRIAGMVKWVIAGLLTATLTIFTAYVTIGGAISGQADAVSVKAARTTLSTMLPVVGGIIADASDTVLTGAAVIKNTIGIFGLVVVLGIVLSPVITLAIQYISMKIGAALAGTVGGEELSGYIDSLAGLYSMLLAMVASSAFLLLISIVSCIMAGQG